MNIQELLQTSPANLAEKQFEALKSHVISRLREAIDYVKNNQWEQAAALCAWSPAGDSMGTEHHFIDFEITNPSEGEDFHEVVLMLANLEKIAYPDKIKEREKQQKNNPNKR